MKKTILIILISAINLGIYAQSDPLRPQHKFSHKDTLQEQFKTSESDDDAIILQQNQNLRNKNKIDTKDDQTTPVDTTQKELSEENRHSNGLSMRNGKVMSSENGTLRMLKKDTLLSNGIKVKPNGTVITKDGSKFMMNEGQFIDMSGNLELSKDSIQKRKQ